MQRKSLSRASPAVKIWVKLSVTRMRDCLIWHGNYNANYLVIKEVKFKFCRCSMMTSNTWLYYNLVAMMEHLLHKHPQNFNMTPLYLGS